MTAPISNGPTTHGYTTMRDATCCGAVVFFLTVLDPAKLIGYDRPMLISGSVFMRPLTSR